MSSAKKEGGERNKTARDDNVPTPDFSIRVQNGALKSQRWRNPSALRPLNAPDTLHIDQTGVLNVTTGAYQSSELVLDEL